MSSGIGLRSDFGRRSRRILVSRSRGRADCASWPSGSAPTTNPRRRSRRRTRRRHVNLMAAQKAKKPAVDMVSIDYERVKIVSTVVRLRDVLLSHSHWHSAVKATRLGVEPRAMAFKFALEEATWDFAPEIKTLEIQLDFHIAA